MLCDVFTMMKADAVVLTVLDDNGMITTSVY